MGTKMHRRKYYIGIDCQEIKLVQKVRELWLANSDKSIKYFHAIINKIRNRIRVHALKNQIGLRQNEQ